MEAGLVVSHGVGGQAQVDAGDGRSRSMYCFLSACRDRRCLSWWREAATARAWIDEQGTISGLGGHQRRRGGGCVIGPVSISPPTTHGVSDALLSVRAGLEAEPAPHQAIGIRSGRQAVRRPELRLASVLHGNLKTSIMGACHTFAIRRDVPCNQAELQCRDSTCRPSGSLGFVANRDGLY